MDATAIKPDGYWLVLRSYTQICWFWKVPMIYVLAALASVGVAAGLSAALYGWFKLSLHRFHVVVARDLLSRWDAQLAELSEHERDQQRLRPPLEVLEAVVALPSPRLRQISAR